MTGIISALSSIGDPVHDADEESYHIFTNPLPNQNLGIIDARAPSLDISIGSSSQGKKEHEYTILQSPGILASDRKGGTTGAVLWKITPLLASWLSDPNNPLRLQSPGNSDSNPDSGRLDVINPKGTVVELGCGISGLLALTLAPSVRGYLATDQEYVRRLFHQNVLDNISTAYTERPKGKNKQKTQTRAKGGKSSPVPAATGAASATSEMENIGFTTLDWEEDDPITLKECIEPSSSDDKGFDVLVSCDCIYNEALVGPFVSTCADICRLRERGPGMKPTVCVIAQQQRSPDVFEMWLRETMREFMVWRVSDRVAGEELRVGSGYMVHLLVLKEKEKD